MKYLLVIGCSERKTFAEDPVPAGQLYEGLQFCALRNRFVPNDLIDVFIVSAEYGLISWWDKVVYYDRRMDTRRALFLHEQVSTGLLALLTCGAYTGAMINLSSNYMHAVGLNTLAQSTIPIELAQGSFGMRIEQVCAWVGRIY